MSLLTVSSSICFRSCLPRKEACFSMPTSMISCDSGGRDGQFPAVSAEFSSAFLKLNGSARVNAAQKPKHLSFLKCSAPAVLAAVIAVSPLLYSPVAQAADTQKVTTLFGRSCIGCHDGGGNIIQPGATLFLNDLKRNGVDTEDEIYRVTYSGKGRMPGFGENCTPRGQCTFGPRLRDDEIKLLAEFVKLQAEQGWPAIDSSED